MKIADPVVVTPDVGGIKMARAYAKALAADLAIVDKRRVSGSEIAVEHLIGEVEGRNVLIVDDMISTGGLDLRGRPRSCAPTAPRRSCWP
jgi:ribose-phosphate pyrophosphokinase